MTSLDDVDDSSSDESSTTMEILRLRERLLGMRERLANHEAEMQTNNDPPCDSEEESIHSDVQDELTENESKRGSQDSNPSPETRRESEDIDGPGSPEIRRLASADNVSNEKPNNRAIPIDILSEKLPAQVKAEAIGDMAPSYAQLEVGSARLSEDAADDDSVCSVESTSTSSSSTSSSSTTTASSSSVSTKSASSIVDVKKPEQSPLPQSSCIEGNACESSASPAQVKSAITVSFSDMDRSNDDQKRESQHGPPIDVFVNDCDTKDIIAATNICRTDKSKCKDTQITIEASRKSKAQEIARIENKREQHLDAEAQQRHHRPGTTPARRLPRNFSPIRSPQAPQAHDTRSESIRWHIPPLKEGSPSSPANVESGNLLRKQESVERHRNSASNTESLVPDEQPDTLEFKTTPEVEQSMYAPSKYRRPPPPILRNFTPLTRPIPQRVSTPISSMFAPPISKMWTSKFDKFNHMQSEMASALCYTDDNIVVSAPTGAGKTGVFEMAIARFAAIDMQTAPTTTPTHFLRLTKARKMVYIAPSKALILSTPEKWSSITRRWTENFYLLASVKLFMLDEVHLIGDSSRGCCLESITLRMKTIQQAARAVRASEEDIKRSSYPKTNTQAIASCMRMVAVSATLPNISDIAEFISANEAYSFDSSYRPVPLTIHTTAMGYVGRNQYRFWSSLDRHVPELIDRFSSGKQTLVFCHSKKEAEKVAELLLPRDRNQDWSGLRDVAAQIKSSQLQRCVLRGVAFHHAGLQASDRKIVERTFVSGKIHSLCATSTLAMGVNLPAHLVIIKGTMTWRGGASGYQEIDGGTLLQMIGRAGRPGLDTSGTAVIMTDNASKHRIAKLAQGLSNAKSQLTTNLVEVLNVEVSQRVIVSLEDAVMWMKRSLFYIQLQKLGGRSIRSSQRTSCHPDDDSILRSLCHEALKNLKGISAIYEDEDGAISPLPASHIMSQNVVPFQAMQLVVPLPFDATQCQIIKALCQIESMHFPVRRHEKKILNACHKAIKFKLEGPPSKVRVQNPFEKTFVLIQAAIGQEYLEDYTLRHEMGSVVENACRILTAAQEYNIKGPHHGQAALQCLKMRRSLCTSLWSASDGVLNQIPGIGQSCTGKLRMNGINTFADVMKSSDDAIETAAAKEKPFGKQLRALVSSIFQNKLVLSTELVRTRGTNIPFEVRCTLGEYRNEDHILLEAGGTQTQKGTARISYLLIAFTDRPGSCMFYQENISSGGVYRFKCPPSFGKICVHLVASVVGLDDKVEIDGNNESNRPGALSDHRAISAIQQPGRGIGEKSILSSPKDLPRVIDCNETEEDPGLHQAQTNRKKSRIIRSRPTIHQLVPVVSSRNWKATPQHSAVTPSPKAPITASEFLKQAPLSQEKSCEESCVQDPGSNMNMQKCVQNFREHKARGVETRSRPTISGVDPHWRQAKRIQQKAQKRAYTSKTSNPFANYRCDPNDFESNLAALSDASPSTSVIPNDKLQSMHAKPYRGYFGGERQTPAMSRSSRKRCLPTSEEKLSDRALLHMKAREHAEIISSYRPERVLAQQYRQHINGNMEYTAQSLNHQGQMILRHKISLPEGTGSDFFRAPASSNGPYSNSFEEPVRGPNGIIHPTNFALPPTEYYTDYSPCRTDQYNSEREVDQDINDGAQLSHWPPTPLAFPDNETYVRQDTEVDFMTQEENDIVSEPKRFLGRFSRDENFIDRSEQRATMNESGDDFEDLFMR